MYIHLTGEANYGCPHKQTGRGYPSSRGPPTEVFFPDFFTSPGMIVGDSMLCYDSLEKLQSSRIGSEFGSLSELVNIAVL